MRHLLRNNRRQRGTTIIELMTVIVVLGLLMTMLAAIISPLLHSESRTQAKVDTVQSAAAALYRIQRDLRQTSFNSAYACTTGGSATCSEPTTFGTTTAIAFPSAYNGGTGQFLLLSSGYPNWKGFMVYWVDSAGDLNWAFDPNPTGFAPGNKSQNSATAAQAVVDATTGVVKGTEIAENIRQLSLAIPGTANVISLRMQAQSTENGAVNETTYRSDVLARQ